MFRTSAVGRERLMKEHSLVAEDQEFIPPTRCGECDDNAHLIRRAPYAFEGLEIRTFECVACGHQMERIVPSKDPSGDEAGIVPA
jgi:Zn ribbon nucleic-acid-binding protein